MATYKVVPPPVVENTYALEGLTQHELMIIQLALMNVGKGPVTLRNSERTEAARLYTDVAAATGVR